MTGRPGTRSVDTSSRAHGEPPCACLAEQSRRSSCSPRRRPRGWSARSPSTSTAAAYRLDAWRSGSSPGSSRAADARDAATRSPARLHLGAYGWLEDVRPRRRGARRRCSSPATLAKTFADRRPAARARHAPTAATSTRRRSTTRAPPPCCATATSPTPRRTNPGALAVNLSSERVRLGARRCSRACATARASARCSATGSSAACTTGTASPRSTASSIALRKAFPLRADRLPRHRTADDAPIEAVEARNVIDGLRARRARAAAPARRLSVRPHGLPAAAAAERGGDRAEVDAPARRPRRGRATSRWPRASTRRCRATPSGSPRTLDAYTRATSRPSPRSSGRRRSGITLTHRVGAAPRARPRPRRAARDAARAGRAGGRRVARRRAAAARDGRLPRQLGDPARRRRRAS